MRYKLLYAVFSLLLVFVACSSEDAVVNKENGKMSRVLLNIPTSEQLESVKSLFFKDGKLNNTASVSPTGGELKLPLEGAGNLYLVVNEGGKLSFSAGSGMTEEAWQDATPTSTFPPQNFPVIQHLQFLHIYCGYYKFSNSTELG